MVPIEDTVTEDTVSPVEQKVTLDKAVSVNEFVTPDKTVTVNGMDALEHKPAEDMNVKTHRREMALPHEPIKFCIMSAMCHGNRGIAKDLKLPWPPLRYRILLH